jgi:hypothetical protein
VREHRLWLSVTAFVALALIASVVGRATDSVIQTKADRWQKRQIVQSQAHERYHLRLVDPRAGIPNESDGASAISGGVPSPASTRASPAGAYSSATTPPPSPGLVLNYSAWDAQYSGSGGYEVARLPGNDCVHFAWTGSEWLSPAMAGRDRISAYTSYSISTGELSMTQDGAMVSLSFASLADGTNLDVDGDNLAHLALHQRQDLAFPSRPWHLYMPVPCLGLHVDDELEGGSDASCSQTLWPRIAASRGGDSAVVHEVAIEDLSDCRRGLLYYWRYTGGTWAGPAVIDSSEFPSYAIADDPNSNKVAVALNPKDGNPLINVAYHASSTSGYGWINGAELGPSSRHYISNYAGYGPQAWPSISSTYDNSGTLHVVWIQQKVANNSERRTIYDWNSVRQTNRPVALTESCQLPGCWDVTPLVANATVGIGDGSTMCSNGTGMEANYNYVYVCYTKFGGETPAEQADVSASGLPNGELYLALSNSGGNTWSPPTNLTNTKTPNCNPGPADTLTGLPANPANACRSEDWASIGRAVSDIDIFFISDIDAGAATQGEGTWQMNPVMYLRLRGGTPGAQYICPVIAPVFEATLTSSPQCEYHSSQTGTDVETLAIINLGNATLSGVISITTNFTAPAALSLSGGTGPYTIPAGNPDVIKTVTMAANNAPEGLYHGSISITHNDATKSSPRVYPIDYFVVNNFFCPEDRVLKTGVASPGSLALQVESDGRFASQNADGGLWRASDSSSSIFDASLLIAHDAQGPDTTVFLHFFSRATNGQFGFRALGNLVIDTSEYGTGNGYATATAYLCTKDSVVGIKMSWYFPQSHADDEFVIAQYKVFRNKPTVPITGLVIGVLEDQDVVPAAKLGSIQTGVTNSAAGDASRKLGYQIGVDTVGAPPSNYRTATRFRGGVASCGTWQGVYVGNSPDDIQPGGGPTDGFLYKQLTSLSGVNLFTDSSVDMYTLMALDKGKSIAAGDTLIYTLVFASDTVSDASFKATVDAGLAAAGALSLCDYCSCDCPYDPNCDHVVSDILDVVLTIDRAFRGAPPTQDPGCPYERTDVDASGGTDIIDVSRLVNVAFRGQSPESQYDLNPCIPGDQ